MSTVIPNPADFIFNENAEPEVNPLDFDWGEYTIGGKRVVGTLVETLSNVINGAAKDFKKDGEINLTFGDLVEVIDGMYDEDYDEDLDDNGEMENFVDEMGYTYKQYCIEAALDKFVEAGWGVDIEYTDPVSREKVADSTKKCLSLLDTYPLLKAIFGPDDETAVDLETAMWIAANELESNKSVVTIYPDADEDEDDDENTIEITEEEPTPEATEEETPKEEPAVQTKESIIDDIINELRHLLG